MYTSNLTKKHAICPMPASPEWGPILENMSTLERMARRMASVDRRIDPDEMLQEFLADLASAADLYDPKRGPWMAWARTRCWKARTYALRTLNKHEPRTIRVDVAGISGGDRETSAREDVAPVTDPTLGTEAASDLRRIRNAAGPALRAFLDDVLSGRDGEAVDALRAKLVELRQLGSVDGLTAAESAWLQGEARRIRKEIAALASSREDLLHAADRIAARDPNLNRPTRRPAQQGLPFGA